ncbi:insulinoma-associated protein 1a-like [Lissotriton helveticus]
MPRGFLVKRTRKPGPLSYRVREDDDDRSQSPLPISFASVITSTWMHPERPRPILPVPILGTEVPATGCGVTEASCAPACSPGRPVGTLQHDQSLMDRTLNSSSPVLTASFPASLAAFASLGQRLAFLPSYAAIEAKLDSICTLTQSAKRPGDTSAISTDNKVRVQAKRLKTEKKSCRDEMTTSPVLGLRIREDPEDAKHRGQASSPLGGFVCQLCREQYADPLSLAQHKCSRIIRVEYRCDECDKVFSCPANLASHRRWHKPRSPPTVEQQVAHLSDNAKENQSPGPEKQEVATPSPQTSDSDEDLYDCSHCNKKFRRQAYLRKHLALHNRSSAAATMANVLLESQALSNVSSESHSPASIQGLPHSPPRDEPLALVFKESKAAIMSLSRTSASYHGQGAQAHPCRFCPETLFSSAGLTRHINRCHPSETRQVILLQVPQHA